MSTTINELDVCCRCDKIKANCVLVDIGKLGVVIRKEVVCKGCLKRGEKYERVQDTVASKGTTTKA